MELLNKYREQLPPELFTKPFELPVTDGSGNNREALRGALVLLEQAGWKVQDRKLVNADGQQFSFEILLDQPAFEAPVLLPDRTCELAVREGVGLPPGHPWAAKRRSGRRWGTSA